MPIATAEKRAEFRRLHREGCFVIPNPWDIGGIRRLEALGFRALASTSSGAALALGREDGQLARDEVLDHLRTLCNATDLPINADFEAGFADGPEGVAENVGLAIETGVAGLSIEDRAGDGLYPASLAAERIRAARESIDRSGQDVLLVGRSEGFLVGQTDLDATIARLVAYAEAGADCLYAPGVRDLDAIGAIVAAVTPRPVNVLLLKGMSVDDLAGVGVRRVSIGGAFARVVWAAFDEAARSVRDAGRLPG